MAQAFPESEVPPRVAGEPIGKGPGCPQCGSSEGLRPDDGWGGMYGPNPLYCQHCGLSGIRPHFAGVEEGEVL